MWKVYPTKRVQKSRPPQSLSRLPPWVHLQSLHLFLRWHRKKHRRAWRWGAYHFFSCEFDPDTFHSEFRLQAIAGALVGHDVGIWFLSWLVESLSFRWVHAQQLRPLTVDVEPVTEKKSTSARSCYTFGLEPPYLDLLRYIFLPHITIIIILIRHLHIKQMMFFWSTAILQRVIKNIVKKLSRSRGEGAVKRVVSAGYSHRQQN